MKRKKKERRHISTGDMADIRNVFERCFKSEKAQIKFRFSGILLKDLNILILCMFQNNYSSNKSYFLITYI